jgi:hypothetical protein
MSSVTSGVGGGLFDCFTCLHVPYSTVTFLTVWSKPWSDCSIFKNQSRGNHMSLPSTRWDVTEALNHHHVVRDATRLV